MNCSTFSRQRLLHGLPILALLLAALFASTTALADSTAQTLPFSQNWANTGLITVSDDWSGVPGIVGYRGDNLTSVNDVNPQTVLADETTVDVNANQTNPNTFTTGGVAEFHISDPVVALQGSGTADAPFVAINLNTTGTSNVTVSYDLRDIDGSADNAVQQFALQYRLGASGNFTNIPAGYVADATTGPSLATLVTPVNVVLPAAADNQPLVQVRIITTNASGNDEWVGIDNISITGSDLPPSTDPTGTGAANPSTVPTGFNTLLTVTVTPGANPPSTGLAVACDLSPVGGSNPQAFFDDGTNGDVAPSDNIFSFLATVGANTSAGNKNLPCDITDDQARTGNASIAVTVIPFLPIGTVQGSVGDADNGLTHRSSYAPATGNGSGQTVAVQGVIYQKTLARTASGGSQYGFFIQNTAATADSDPNSSDGIFVFMGGFSDLIGGYVPQVGDEVVISGRVVEFFFLTELSSARLLSLVQSGVDLDAELLAFEVNPPDILADANRYWERREGMRAQVPAGSVAIDGRDVFPSTADGEVWLARGDSQIAQSTDPYARRAFRDPHPLDNDPALFDDGNGYRIILGSLGVKAAANDNTVLLAPARSYDTLTNAPVGGLYFSFNKYQIMVEQQLELTAGVDPALNAPPQDPDRAAEYSLATFNVENLYDYRDDPFDGCDFNGPGNPGCPPVVPPNVPPIFDYVPASNAVYQARLAEIAEQIITKLHSPDIILAQEAEDQDLCTVTGGALACGASNNADGRPDTLQELATVIASLGGPAYDAAYDRDGADDRGIVSAYLYRTDRVELLPASATDPVLGNSPTVDYRGDPLAYNTDAQNPKALNADLPADVDLSTGVDGPNVFTRPPQVGLFRIWRGAMGASAFTNLYALDNHFSSTPDARVGQRQEQANYNAAIVEALQAVNVDVRAVVGGDLNVYPRPDDPFTPGHPRYPSDQLAGLYNQGLNNLYDILVAEVPVSAYSYVFQGQTQTLDQIFVTPSVLDELVQFRAAHINSDFPADYDGDGPRGTSDHDPQVARIDALTVVTLENLVRYYRASGDITGNNTARILLDRLAKARRYLERGQMDAYREQLMAFITQVQDFTPQFISQTASDALVQETELLLMQP